MEKDINLELAKTFAAALERDGRFRVVLTRSDDTFIPLEERTRIANEKKADLFVSFHCNAALSDQSNGFEIYFLSEKATDDAAAATARRENAVVELEGVAGKAKMQVQRLLWSMAKNETMNESSELAALVNQRMKDVDDVAARGVRQANFFVLRGANMPAVLVESAFITHKREEKLLRSRSYQSRLVQAVHSGLMDYEKRLIQSRQASSRGAREP
jgi:N-acetylmuramoyl-L-alanine amidase